MQLIFFGGARAVTGSNYLIKVGKTQVLIDCGLFQGPPELVELNALPFPYDPKSIDYIFVTHSHLDHCGRLAKLVKEGFKGQIFCTPPTRDLMEVALQDAIHLMEEEYQDKGIIPLYGEEHLKEMLKLVQTFPYENKTKLNANIEFNLKDAGHILGSSMVELFLSEGRKKIKIVFTGDLGNPPTPLLNPPAIIESTDYLIIDSAYGDRIHENRSQRKELLNQAITDIIKRKGVMLIPSFAIERTQELLYELNDLVENKKISQVPIYMDSPLAIKITQVYKKHEDYFNKTARYIINSGDDIFAFKGLEFTPSKEESKAINKVPPPKIILAGAGMSTGGRILYHEKLYLNNPNNMFLIIGFQVEGTLGRKIFDGLPLVHIMGDEIKNKIETRAIGGYSAHADQRQILNFIKQIKTPIKNVFPTQSEKKAALAIQKLIKSELGINAEVPKYEQVVEL
jgi:metallo-beta-lactamase family protein